MNSPIPSSIENVLAVGNLKSILRETLRCFDCEAGTIHWLDLQSGMLTLAAQHNIPPHIAQIVGTVPIGKGMAGLAAQRREPVAICNLQTDDSGEAKPAAKDTGMEGSLAVPILTYGELRGVLGVAKTSAHDWSEEEKSLLLAVASAIGEKHS